MGGGGGAAATGGTGALDAGVDAGGGSGKGADDSGDDGGCGCRTTSSRSHGAWLLGLGALALFRLRRGRRS